MSGYLEQDRGEALQLYATIERTMRRDNPNFESSLAEARRRLRRFAQHAIALAGPLQITPYKNGGGRILFHTSQPNVLREMTHPLSAISNGEVVRDDPTLYLEIASGGLARTIDQIRDTSALFLAETRDPDRQVFITAGDPRIVMQDIRRS
jgi:hypothetical protein